MTLPVLPCFDLRETPYGFVCRIYLREKTVFGEHDYDPAQAMQRALNAAGCSTFSIFWPEDGQAYHWVRELYTANLMFIWYKFAQEQNQ